MKKCKVCGEQFRPRFSTVEMFCSGMCAAKYKREQQEAKPPTKRKRIPAFSTKRASQMHIYTKKRREWLKLPQNQICFIPGCGKRATTVEHTRGRSGFADDEARDKNISLLIDQRFWKPCCLEHNLELENNSELSKANQLSKIHGGRKV